MKFKDFIKQQQDLMARFPETADMEVMQTSCFDNPYRFETMGVSMGEMYPVVDANDSNVVLAQFSNDDDAQNRVEEEGDWTTVGFWENVIVIGGQ